MRKICRFWNLLPLFARITFCLAACSLLILILCIFNVAFADFFNLHISPVFRAALGYLTSPLPFSLAESIIITLPVTAVAAMIVCTRRALQSRRQFWSCVSCLTGVLCLIFSLFVLTLGCGYHGNTVDYHLGLKRTDVTSEELAQTARYLQSKAEAELEEISFLYGSSSVMPFSLDELNDKLISAYDKVACEYDFIPHLYTGVKGIMLSRPMAYTHISGVYTFFTGEANVNLYFPDYTIPYTAAHEMSHQRGVAKEDEANFMAFLVCTQSDDPYVRYSGYMNLYEYVLNALHSADQKAYAAVYYEADPLIRQEMRAYSVFYNTIRDSVASEISGAVNNTYLIMQGQTAGSRSYGMVVDLAVAYFRDRPAQ